MKDYLIKFDYDYYCQGYEKDTISVLVRANNFEEAIEKIKTEEKYQECLYAHARNFVNLTIE